MTRLPLTKRPLDAHELAVLRLLADGIARPAVNVVLAVEPVEQDAMRRALRAQLSERRDLALAAARLLGADAPFDPCAARNEHHGAARRRTVRNVIAARGLEERPWLTLIFRDPTAGGEAS